MENDRQDARRRAWSTRAIRMLRVAGVVYLFVLLMLVLLENYLIFPAPVFPRGGDWQTPAGFEDVTFASEDGNELHGWFVEHPKPRAVLLYCHGNGENVANLRYRLEQIVDEERITVLAFDYRGYGRSAGKAEEHGVLADGVAAHRWLAERTGLAPDQIVLLGRSLGGAVAVHTAAEHGARGLILERTFTTMPDVAASLYPWLPVRWVMKSRFDSLSKIRRYEGPLLQTHGTHDEIIPFSLGERLFEAAVSGDKSFIVDDGGTHNGPLEWDYLRALGDFVDRLPPVR